MMTTRLDLTRRRLLAAAGGLALAACTGGQGGGAGNVRFKIGHQKNGVLLLARRSGRVEQALSTPPAAKVEWLEFSAGPPLLEAMAVGSVQLGSTGDAPPIFAQAGGAPIQYVAAVRLSGQAGGILVPPNSTARSVADLRGKRVAFTRGSSAHNSVAALLEAAGMTLADVTEVHLAPSDAAAAFDQGGIDGWVIWDPFFSSARQRGARVLEGGTQLPPSAAFFLAHRDFVANHPDVLKRTLDALAAEGRWAVENRPAVAEMLARETGLPLALLQDTVQREDFTLTPLNDEILAAQQTAADRFARLGLIPAPVRVADMAWREWQPT